MVTMSEPRQRDGQPVPVTGGRRVEGEQGRVGVAGRRSAAGLAGAGAGVLDERRGLVRADVDRLLERVDLAEVAGEGVGGRLVLCGGGAGVMRRAALPSSGLYPLAVLCLALTAYGVAAAAHASPFAAIYVAALILGNSELPHRVATRSFAEGVAWLAQIGLFVMLGLLLSPARIDLQTVVQALVTGLVLTVVARPLSVFVSSVVQPMAARDLAFISWAGLRGAVPIVLATIPLAEARGLEVEAAPLDKVAADLLQVTIAPTSKMHGVEVGELRLPQGASVSLVVRAGNVLVPERRTVLRSGDDLLVVAPRKLREATEARLRQVSENGRLAQWLGETPRRERD